MNPCFERQLETCADPRRGIDRELRTGDARPFFDDGRSNAPLLQLAIRQSPLEIEALAVVFDDQRARLIGVRQSDEDVACAAVLAHVHQRFLDDTRQLECGRSRKLYRTTVEHESRGNAGVAPEPLDQ